MPRDDLNFKLAIEAGVRHLQRGQLRKAEEQFRFAIKRCADCGAGYRGLAKVFVELEDRTRALETLRDGAQTLARSGNRVEAIELLRDAVRLDPADLAPHRRLAAALANAGDEAGAAAEYERFVSQVLAQGDVKRARLELSYARASLGDVAALQAVQGGLVRTGIPEGHDLDGLTASPPAPPPAVAPEPARPVPEPPAPVAEQALPADPRERALLLEARAQTLLARGDLGAAAAGVEAAAALLGAGLTSAASDLLLQVIGTGTADREAQRLLADLAGALGRGDLGEQKHALLTEAAGLDPRGIPKGHDLTGIPKGHDLTAPGARTGS